MNPRRRRMIKQAEKERLAKLTELVQEVKNEEKEIIDIVDWPEEAKKEEVIVPTEEVKEEAPTIAENATVQEKVDEVKIERIGGQTTITKPYGKKKKS